MTAAALLVALAPAASRAANGDCAQPLSNGSGPNTSDCLSLLKSSVGSIPCAICVCDTNGSHTITTVDALVCLKKAVGQDVALSCPPCDGVTTTTDGGTVSTTSTSTTSTTTTVPVRCTDNADCSSLPDPFRCNPNTGTCEKPCTKNADCKDFYECNLSTGYCQEPALLF